MQQLVSKVVTSLLDEDIAQAFPDEKAVNEALRLLMNLAKQQEVNAKTEA